MLGEVEKTMIEQTRDNLKEAISRFPLAECLKEVASIDDMVKMRAQMEKLRGGLTPGEPLYEFCNAVIAYCNEQMAMTRLLVRQIDGILEENKEG